MFQEVVESDPRARKVLMNFPQALMPKRCTAEIEHRLPEDVLSELQLIQPQAGADTQTVDILRREPVDVLKNHEKCFPKDAEAWCAIANKRVALDDEIELTMEGNSRPLVIRHASPV